MPSSWGHAPRRSQPKAGYVVQRVIFVDGRIVHLFSCQRKRAPRYPQVRLFRAAPPARATRDDACRALDGLGRSPLAHRSSEKPYRSGEFRFRQVKYANVVALLGSAPAGAKVSRPEIHHDDTEVCWVTTGKLRLTLPHEQCVLAAGDSIQFDAIQQHTYEALADSQLIILHLRKDKRY